MLKATPALLASAGLTLAVSAVAAHALLPAKSGAPTPQQCQGVGPGGSAQKPTTNVTATDTRGVAYGSDPSLSSVQTVRLTVTGFAPSANVAIRLGNTTTTIYRAASRTGTLSYQYGINHLARGQYRLLFQSNPPTGGTQPAPGNVVVAVPRIGIFPFRVSCGPTGKPAVKVRTTVTLTASPSTIAAGQKVTLTGRITYSGTATKISGLPVTLWRSVAGGAWHKLASGKTKSTGKTAGTLTWTERPSVNTRYELRYAGGTVAGRNLAAATSKAIAVRVRTHAAVSAPKSTAHGRQTTIRAVVGASKGRLVYLQVDGKTIASAKTGAKGRATFNVTLSAGSHSVRVYVPATRSNAATYSPTTRIKVS